MAKLCNPQEGQGVMGEGQRLRWEETAASIYSINSPSTPCS
jgi:hypothetical protein